MPRLSPLLVLPFGGVHPRFADEPDQTGAGAAVLGRVSIGRRARLGPHAVIRADGDYVEIGDDFRLGAHSTVHIAHEIYPTLIGDRVSVGVNACVHACTVGNDVIVGDGAVILDGSIVEDEVILEAGAFAFPRARLQRGQVYAGAPAKPVRAVAPGEIEQRREKMLREASPADREAARATRQGVDRSAFIASTASVRGDLRMAAKSSLWFSVDVDARSAAVSIGPNTNVQDNTVIRCSTAQGVTIGRDTTIGHNVVLEDCVIGDEALIGIGSVVAKGTVVENHVLLAAGARTEPGQVLEAGWLYGRAPAQKIAPLDQGKRDMIKFIIFTYRQYAEAFMAIEKELVDGS